MGTCNFNRENITLYFYDELAVLQRVELQDHLNRCTACMEEFLAMQRLLNKIPQQPPVQPDSATLDLLRNLISLQIRKRQPEFPRLRGIFTFIQPRPAFQWGFAVLLLTLGFFIGKSTATNSAGAVQQTLGRLLAAQQDITTGNAVISPFLLGIERINYDAATGKIEIAYNTINDIRLRSATGDRKVHALLQMAMLEAEDYAVRLQAVKTVNALAAVEPQLLDAAYLQVFSQLLNSESNLGLRLQVLQIFKNMPWSREIKSILQNILLNDQDNALRIAAFRTITEHEKPTVKIRDLLTAAKNDSSTFIKYRANKLLEELKNSESIPLRKED